MTHSWWRWDQISRCRPFRLALVAIAACGVVLWIADLLLMLVVVRPSWTDNSQTYAAAGRHLLTGQPIYAAFQLAGPYGLGEAASGRGFVYPPTAAVLFTPLAPFEAIGLAWVSALAWVLLGVLTYRLARSMGLSAAPATQLALFVTISGPAINAMSSGNVNLMIADALLASWLWPRASGVLAVLGGLIKFFPAAGLVWTIRKRSSLRWPIALGIGIVAVSTLIVGPSGWADFLTAFGHGRPSPWHLIASPTQLLGPVIGTLVGYGLASLALLGAWRIGNERVAFALLGWAMILPAPDWWSHYLVIPLAAAMPLAVSWLAQASVAPRMRPSRIELALPEPVVDGETARW